MNRLRDHFSILILSRIFAPRQPMNNSTGAPYLATPQRCALIDKTMEGAKRQLDDEVNTSTTSRALPQTEAEGKTKEKWRSRVMRRNEGKSFNEIRWQKPGQPYSFYLYHVQNTASSAHQAHTVLIAIFAPFKSLSESNL